jgi:hypothetical protein
LPVNARTSRVLWRAFLLSLQSCPHISELSFLPRKVRQRGALPALRIQGEETAEDAENTEAGLEERNKPRKAERFRISDCRFRILRGSAPSRLCIENRRYAAARLCTQEDAPQRHKDTKETAIRDPQSKIQNLKSKMATPLRVLRALRGKNILPISPRRGRALRICGTVVRSLIEDRPSKRRRTFPCRLSWGGRGRGKRLFREEARGSGL